MKDIIGFYHSRDEAERVKDDLLAAGFDRDDITIYDRSGRDEASFWESMKDAFGFADHDDREIYTEAAHRGSVAVGLSFDQDDPGPQKAAQIMNRHNPIDLDSQSGQWRQQGWQPRQRAATSATTAGAAHRAPSAQPATRAGAQAAGEKAVIPVVEEQVQIGKREVVGGGIRIHSRVIQKPVREQVQLREEHVHVERHPVDRPLSDADRAFQERAVEVTERSEQPVVAKTARVVEEVVVNKDVQQRTHTVEETARRTDVNVEKIPGPATTAGASTTAPGRDADFSEDHYAQELASDQRYRGRDWTTLEPTARADFEKRYPGRKWDQVKDAVHRGYDRMRSKV